MRARCLVAILLTACVARAGRAATGDLDVGFGDHGFVTRACCPASLAEAADGTLLLGHTSPVPQLIDPALSVLRVAPDGGDLATWEPPFARFVVIDVLPDAGGGAVVAGVREAPDGTSSEPLLVKLDADGLVDPSYGIGGVVEIDSIGTDWLGAVSAARAPDGSIFVNGTLGCGNEVVHVLSGGAIDATFGQGGVARVDVACRGFLQNLAVTGDGFVVANGTIDSGGSPRTWLVRLTPSGTLDPSFGTGGMVVDERRAARSTGMALDREGRIVTARVPANADEPTLEKFISPALVARFMPDGTPDAGFAVGGELAITLRSLDLFAFEVAADAVDRIVVVGAADSQDGFVRFGWLARLTTGGVLDPAFGDAGITTVPFEPVEHEFLQLFHVTVAADGGIVAGGTHRARLGEDDANTLVLRFAATDDTSLALVVERVSWLADEVERVLDPNGADPRLLRLREALRRLLRDQALPALAVADSDPRALRRAERALRGVSRRLTSKAARSVLPLEVRRWLQKPARAAGRDVRTLLAAGRASPQRAP